jgi:hypothetical protein
MKKFVKSFLLAAAALMLFAGCSNLGNDATVSGEDGKAVLTIGIDGFTGSSSRSAARTVNPAEITDGSAFSKITIKGESESYDSMDEIELTFTDGTATIELTYDVWYLTLTAYNSDNQPILEGHRRVDMKNGAPASNTPITFTLSADGVKTAGGVTLSGTFTDTDGLAVSYAAALYDLNSNEIILNEAGTSTLKTGTCTGDNKGKFSYTVANVKPGRYNFRIYFKNADGTNIGTWGDIVVIAPGRTTSDASIALGDILMKKPEAPTALSAYFLDNSVAGNYYNALITWTRDSVHNEEYFELTINDVTETSDVYKIFTNETVAADKKEVFFESASRVDGTLAAGSEYCIVKLPVGKKFEISIKAVNFLGASDAKDRDSATAASAITLADGTAVSANTAYGDEAINLMKITYDLNGGALKLSESAGKITGNYIKYEIFKDADITLLTPSATGYPQLTNGHHPWQSWKNSAGTAVTEVSEFGNVTVTASYNLTSLINYVIDDSYGTITATVKTANGDDVTNGTITSNGSLTIEVDGDDVTHVKVTFLVPSGDDVTIEDDDSSVLFNRVNALPNGTYEVQIIATKTDGKLYSFVCAVTKNQ